MSSTKTSARARSSPSRVSGSASRPRDEQSTRRTIVAVAERLFAERGLDAVSLIEIGVAAGQKNRSAVQYHFHDKAGLLDAIFEKHQVFIEERRVQRLNALEATGEGNLRDFVNALVRPLAEEILNADGGLEYVVMTASLIGHPEFSPVSRERTSMPTPARLLGHIAHMARELPHELVGPRMLLTTGMLFHGLADWARMAANQGAIDPVDWEVFVSNLVDCFISVLETPV